ncbi:hypothetical protein MYSTI_00348 [Myxococcus stipitatus DSM 14675]|uniref:Uncharacterized protein n=1 Tax=Myxococcus stipitatus (strain DSM 14675 / JCM 12634 / Mx s8) TaxID=1278073 RepID=L7TYV7_MYXSD|nr:hypothetical protein [Myxococcus stipitatus]AGC41706.1 hypothetical protein MYSTI_00348 [Myxococcus stipitatus DSM 14675]
MRVWIRTDYYSASGPTLDACAFLGQRYDEERGYKPFEGECWVMSLRPKTRKRLTVRSHLGSTGWLSRLWRSPKGAVFVTSITDAKVLYHPDLHGDPEHKFESTKLSGPLNGVWGLDEDFVLTWGSTYEGTQHVLRYNGRKWRKMPAPKFAVRAMHGLAPDFIYAVGVGGGIARWNGKVWRHFRSPTREVLNSVFVAAEDELYATGGSGSLLAGNRRRWDSMAESPVPGMPLLGVAKWKKKLWVAGGRFGLFKWMENQNTLKCIKPNLRAVDLDARQDLLISCEDFVAVTSDGRTFIAGGRDALMKLRKGKKLGRL